MATQHRPQKGWGWLALNGAVTLVLGVLLIAGLPGTAGCRFVLRAKLFDVLNRVCRVVARGLNAGVKVAGTAASVQGFIPEDLYVQVGAR